MKHGLFAQLSSFGVVLHLRANSVPRSWIEEIFLPGWRLVEPDREPHTTIEIEKANGTSSAERFVIEVDRQPVEEHLAVARLARALDQIIHLKIAELSPEAVFLHAGVVAWQKKAILLPGRSMSGKSTLTRALTDAGALYYSDEFAPILPDGRVVPYPKALSVRQSCGDPAKIDAHLLGWRDGLPAVPIAVIAAVRYDPHSAPASKVHETSKAKAVVALLDNAVPAMRASERCLSTAVAATRNARCLEGNRPEAAVFASALLQEA
jgi:hypothetical protein